MPMDVLETTARSRGISRASAAPNECPAGTRSGARAPRSVVCAVDRGSNSRAALRHAQLLVSPRGSVDCIPSAELLNHGASAVRAGCEGHELLLVGAGSAAFGALEHTTIPTLIARSCPLGRDVTDTILVPVDGSSECAEAALLAGTLAAQHGGTVTVMAAPRRDSELQRALAASTREVLDATGVTPRLIGGHIPPDRTIPLAAASLSASLVVLGSGPTKAARSVTAQIARRVGCSVLVVFGSRGSNARNP